MPPLSTAPPSLFGQPHQFYLFKLFRQAFSNLREKIQHESFQSALDVVAFCARIHRCHEPDNCSICSAHCQAIPNYRYLRFHIVDDPLAALLEPIVDELAFPALLDDRSVHFEDAIAGFGHVHRFGAKLDDFPATTRQADLR